MCLLKSTTVHQLQSCNTFDCHDNSLNGYILTIPTDTQQKRQENHELQMLTRTHNVSNAMEYNKILVKGLNRNTSKDALEMYLDEVVQRVSNSVSSVSLEGNGEAIVTFRCGIKDVEELQARCDDMEDSDIGGIQCTMLDDEDIFEEEIPVHALSKAVWEGFPRYHSEGGEVLTFETEKEVEQSHVMGAIDELKHSVVETPKVETQRSLERPKEWNSDISHTKLPRAPTVQGATPAPVDGFKKDHPTSKKHAIQMNPSIIQLLKIENQWDDLEDTFDCRFREDGVVIKSNDSGTIRRAKLKMNELVRDIEFKSKNRKLSQGLVQVFKKNKGYNVLTKKLKQSDLHVVADICDETITFYSMDEQQAESACEIFDQLFINDKFVLKTDSNVLLTQAKWKQHVRNMHNDLVVSVAYQSTQNDVLIAGVKKDVKKAITKVQDYVARHYRIASELKVEHKLHFEKFGKEKLLSAVSGSDVCIREVDSKIIVEGPVDAVTEVKDTWEHMSKTVEAQKIRIDKPGMVGFIRSAMGVGLLKEIDPGKREVTIDVPQEIPQSNRSPECKPPIKPKPKYMIPPYNPGATEGKRLTTQVNTLTTPNNVKLTLTKGDISEQQADVLVNSCFRKLFGSATSKAFLKKGGAEFSKIFQDLKDALEDGEAQYGDVFVTDVGSKINAEKIIHAVCPLYNTSKDGVFDIITKCFEEVTKLGKGSVALPAIGTGYSGFSNKGVWNGILKAVTNIPHDATLKLVALVVNGESSYNEFSLLLNKEFSSSSLKEKTSTDAKGDDTNQYIHTYGQTSLTIEQGDVSEAKADVLVNVLEKNIDLQKSKSKIAKQFLAKGTTEFAEKQLEEMIRKLLKRATYHGLATIALPTIGTGRLIGYPVGVFYNALRACVREYDKTETTLTLVTIYVFDVAMLNELNDILKSEHNGNYDLTDAKHKTSPKKDHDVYHGSSLDVTAVGFTNEAVTYVVQEIKSIIDDNFYTKEFDCFTLRKRDVFKLMDKDEKRTVRVDALSGGRLVLCGAKTSVLVLVSKIIKRKEEYDALGPERFPKGTKEHLLALANEKIQSPAYWKEVPGNSDIFNEIKKFCECDEQLGGTWCREAVGIGSDAKGLTHSTIAVKNIEIIERDDLYKKYAVHRQSLCKLAAEGKIPQTLEKGETNPLTTTLGATHLDSYVIKEINECYLFHGAKEDTIQVISDKGPDGRLNIHGMAGKGVYLAESSTKADQYADSKDARSEGEKHMFLMRALLGNIYVADVTKQYPRPPCIEYNNGCPEPCKESHQMYDSILIVNRPPKHTNQGRLLFREFVLYGENLAYPEFLITYERQ
ncbi:unnamed protein product [Owenia fusiformis]|uniref:Macro domain-containing protein n=1 Tax=Owenia fusiformis TaxID=6347 RepID=A0A8S4NLW6_OWEFU|nr:unnamed protein product [Owenia fusiformis]